MKYPIAGITVLNEGQDIVVLVDTGRELVEVIREYGRFNLESGIMDHRITAGLIHDAIFSEGEYVQPRKQTRIKYS